MSQAEILQQPSDFDPWAEVKGGRVVGAIYKIGNNSMRKGKIVTETDPIASAPYAFIKLDF